MQKLSLPIPALVFTVLLILLAMVLVPTHIPQATAKAPSIVQTTCATIADADLVKTIKEAFAADPQIKDQMRHLNVSVKNRVVTLEGWLDGNPLIRKAVVMVKKTKCVRRVISKLRPRGGGSCGPGQRPCGDICIDKNSECTISE